MSLASFLTASLRISSISTLFSLGEQPLGYEELVAYFVHDIRMFFQEVPGVIPSLPQPDIPVGKPCAALFHDVLVHGEIQNLPFP